VYAKLIADPSALNHWFDRFREAGGRWTDVQMEEVVEEKTEEEDKTGWQWVTRDRAAVLLNNRSLAERKCDIAEKDPDRFKVDEECPDRTDAYLYYIKVYEGKHSGTTKSHAKRTVHKQTLDDEQGTMLARRLAPKLKAAQLRGPPQRQITGMNEAADTKSKEEAAAAAEIARQDKAKAKAVAKAALEASPQYQIGKWLSGLSGLIRECDTRAEEAQAAAKLPSGLQQQYQSVFQRHKASLSELRNDLESTSPNDPNVNAKLGTANQTIASAKADFKAFNLVHNGYYPKAKSS